MKALLTCCCLLLCCCLPLQVKGQVEAGSSQPHLPLSPDAQISNDSMNQYLQFLMLKAESVFFVKLRDETSIATTHK